MASVAALSARFARDIEAAMKARNMSRADLAILLRVSRPYITQVLSGKTNLTFKTASELAMAVGLKSWVVYEVEEPEKKRASRSEAQELRAERDALLVRVAGLERVKAILDEAAGFEAEHSPKPILKTVLPKLIIAEARVEALEQEIAMGRNCEGPFCGTCYQQGKAEAFEEAAQIVNRVGGTLNYDAAKEIRSLARKVTNG